MDEQRRSAKQALESWTQEAKGEPTVGPSTESESVEHVAEMAWARKYGDELARFPGEIVALSAGGVAAHDADLLRLLVGIEELNVGRTYIVAVPATGALAV